MRVVPLRIVGAWGVLGVIPEGGGVYEQALVSL